MLIHVSLGALVAPDIHLGRVCVCGVNGLQNCHLAFFYFLVVPSAMAVEMPAYFGS